MSRARTLRYDRTGAGETDTPGTYDLTWEADTPRGSLTIPNPSVTPVFIQTDDG